MERDVAKDVKVGIFVFLAVALGSIAIFVLGGSEEMFEDRFTLNASFQDVAGMREGATIMLAGIPVGEVSEIRFSEDVGVQEVFVELNLMTRYQARVREDSVARIDTEGMLGDKYISVSVGTTEFPVLNQGDWIKTQEQTSLVQYQKQANQVLANLEGIAKKVNLALGDEQEATQASVANVVMSLETIMKEAESGSGLIHALVYDKKLADQLGGAVTNLEGASNEIAAITTEIRTGDGLANELIYGDEGEKLAIQLGNLAGALESMVGDIKNDDSLVHALIYDPERAAMVKDLHETASALREVAQAVNNAEGTAGLLAKDPELYEDLRALVNGAERNKLLRYYVRKTVEEGEKELAQPWEP